MGESRLEAFQRDFAAALLAEPASTPAEGIAPDPGLGAHAALTAQPGFAVYRNTVLRGCIDALAANYPTVLALVGEDWFEDAAAMFVRAHLPQDGRLALYGDGFADGLEALASAVDLPYLAGVARLDRAWTEAHLAADAPVLVAHDLATLAPEALAAAVLVPHPSARWPSFESVPAFTIWRRHREGLALDDDLPWRGESALLLRPELDVVWRQIDPEAAVFLAACAQGRSFTEAAPKRIADWLPSLVAAGAFTRAEPVRG